jgi:hypothetical protein
MLCSRTCRPSWGGSTGARSSEQLPASANRSSCRAGPERRHVPPGSGDVTPRSRCRRCERIAEPKVRIRTPPAESPRTIGSSAPSRSDPTALFASSRPPRVARGVLREARFAHHRQQPAGLGASYSFVPRYQKFESISLQRRVYKLSVPLKTAPVVRSHDPFAVERPVR